DEFNGVIINKQLLGDKVDQFYHALNELILLAKQQHKQLIWLTLGIEQSIHIKTATDIGFVFHNCLENEITLILRLKKEAYAPFVPTHSIGAGALILNDQQQVLVIREKIAVYTGYKLPGGHIELGEKISSAIVREVFEETGVHSEFLSIQGFASKKSYRFGKSNIYFICRLKAISNTINIQDIDEIAEAKWCDLSEFIADEKNSYFVREIVKNCQHEQGLTLLTLAENDGPNQKHEVFF
ncbi:NUDIX domain-containing protein, partial [Psychromonas sp.]|nr:NUDIX domain-containing protein [Psychromonas sp.]